MCWFPFCYYHVLIKDRGSYTVGKALIFAGDNRVELEKVLYHYNQCVADSLKYKAAHFLIRNMPDYYSYYSPENDSIKDLYQAVAQKKMSEDVAIEVAQKSLFHFWSEIKRLYTTRT